MPHHEHGPGCHSAAASLAARFVMRGGGAEARAVTAWASVWPGPGRTEAAVEIVIAECSAILLWPF